MTQGQVEHIGTLLRKTVATAPDAPAFVAPDLELSRSQFLSVCERYARRMQKEGIRRGDLVSIHTMDGFVSVVCCFALSFIGARYIPFGTDLLDEGAPDVTHFLRDVSQKPQADLIEIAVDGSWFEPVEGQEFSGFENSTDTCWISPSSGTTGRAKFIEISVALLNARVEAVAADYEPGTTRLMILFHGGSRPFIIRAVAALAYGCLLVDQSSPEFAIKQGTNFLCASPQQVPKWLDGKTLFPKIPKIQVSGAKLHDGPIGMLLRNFECVEDVYGSNETIKCLARRWTGTPSDRKVENIRFGQSDVQIVDQNDTPQARGTEGRVRIRTEWMVQGYLNGSESAQESFVDGWFYPGDIGVLGTGGGLEIRRRDGETVNLGGSKVILSDVEAAMEALDNVQSAGCFLLERQSGEADILATCLVLKKMSSHDVTVLEAWRRCADRFGQDVAPSALLVVSELALTDDGVVKRGLAKELFVRTLASAPPDVLSQNLFYFKQKPDHQ